MRRGLEAALAAVAVGIATWSGGAMSQGYPTRTVTLVVPFAAGGPTDVVARSLAASMTRTLGQAVVVENKLGAGGTIAANSVAKASPDGYTIFIHHNGMATATALYRKLPFNPLTDFEYIGQVADVPMTLLARRDFPADNLREFASYVKANKEKINLANAGLGAVSHLCGTLLQQALGVELTPAIAEALYTALVTDTGRFQYSNTTPKALRLAASLIEAGADVTRVFQGVYESVEFAKLKLLGSALRHATIHEGGRVVIAHLTREDFAAAGAEEPFSEGVIDHLRAVEGTELAALIRELPPDGADCKVSLRASIDTLDVSAIARQSGGGGHRQAAGFSSALGVDGIRAFVLDAYRRSVAGG